MARIRIRKEKIRRPKCVADYGDASPKTPDDEKDPNPRGPAGAVNGDGKTKPLAIDSMVSVRELSGLLSNASKSWTYCLLSDTDFESIMS